MDKKSKVLEYVARKGAISVKDIEALQIPRQVLYRLCKTGQLVRIDRGLYRSPEIEPTEHHTIVEVMAAIPKAVICLISALQFHDMTTQMPHKVWIALDRKTRKAKTSLPVLFVKFSGQAFTEGIETHTIEGVQLQVYNPAKTVADCFKYRNKIGLDVAMEALTDCIRQRKATRDQVWHYAKICRVANIIRPYMEAIA
jgi:predicted transcriptional regulator of viral defense system